jgi:hypothetical protein
VREKLLADDDYSSFDEPKENKLVDFEGGSSSVANSSADNAVKQIFANLAV